MCGVAFAFGGVAISMRYTFYGIEAAITLRYGLDVWDAEKIPESGVED